MNGNEIIQRFAYVARPVILSYFPSNSCIASTRIAIEVLARFGVEADALAVGMIVEVKALSLAYVSGFAVRHLATILRLDSAPWDGHLVAIATVGESRYLVDASFDQVSMPEQGLQIAPFVFVAPLPDPTLLTGTIGMILTLVSDTGQKISVRYSPIPNQTFRDAPAWETDHLQPAIATICKLMTIAENRKLR